MKIVCHETVISQAVTMVVHCSHKEKKSKCYNKLKILEIISKLNKNKM